VNRSCWALKPAEAIGRSFDVDERPRVDALEVNARCIMKKIQWMTLGGRYKYKSRGRPVDIWSGMELGEDWDQSRMARELLEKNIPAREASSLLFGPTVVPAGARHALGMHHFFSLSIINKFVYRHTISILRNLYWNARMEKASRWSLRTQDLESWIVAWVK